MNSDHATNPQTGLSAAVERLETLIGNYARERDGDDAANINAMDWAFEELAAFAVPLLPALIAAYREATEWRDIETAPKDGTEITLWSGRFVRVAAWRRDLNAWVQVGGARPYTKPIHWWLPLPSPPEQSGGR